MEVLEWIATVKFGFDFGCFFVLGVLAGLFFYWLRVEIYCDPIILWPIVTFTLGITLIFGVISLPGALMRYFIGLSITYIFSFIMYRFWRMLRSTLKPLLK